MKTPSSPCRFYNISHLSVLRKAKPMLILVLLRALSRSLSSVQHLFKTGDSKWNEITLHLTNVYLKLMARVQLILFRCLEWDFHIWFVWMGLNDRKWSKHRKDAENALKNILVTFCLYRFDLSDRDSFFDSKTRSSLVSIKYCQMHSVTAIFYHLNVLSFIMCIVLGMWSFEANQVHKSQI